jgi:hypothetical protein
VVETLSIGLEKELRFPLKYPIDLDDPSTIAAHNATAERRIYTDNSGDAVLMRFQDALLMMANQTGPRTIPVPFLLLSIGMRPNLRMTRSALNSRSDGTGI